MRKFIALEEDNTDGNFNREIEHVYYARIGDFKQLENATSKVRQEQWEIRLPMTGKNAAKGSVRVRSIKEENHPIQYVLTSKVSLNEAGDKMEVSVNSSAEQFVQFKFLSAQGMVKDRFTFELEGGLKWEIDVFIDPKGGYYEWCKIDFEVPDASTAVPEFPITLTEVIDGTGLERGSATDRKIQALYDQYFLTPNLYKRAVETQVRKEQTEQTANKVQDEVVLD